MTARVALGLGIGVVRVGHVKKRALRKEKQKDVYQPGDTVYIQGQNGLWDMKTEVIYKQEHLGNTICSRGQKLDTI